MCALVTLYFPACTLTHTEGGIKPRRARAAIRQRYLFCFRIPMFIIIYERGLVCIVVLVHRTTARPHKSPGVGSPSSDRVKELKWSAERSVGAAHEMYISRGALTSRTPARTKPRGDTAGEGSAAHSGDLGENGDFLGTS